MILYAAKVQLEISAKWIMLMEYFIPDAVSAAMC